MSEFFVDNSNVFEDYYEILNVDSDATIEEISKNYRCFRSRQVNIFTSNIPLHIR